MIYAEQAIVFQCEGESLVGIVARPERPRDVGVVVIVGGPQYRAGSHRQFVLLARHLAQNGVATFRFDYRGMGDGTGAMRSFEGIDSDIRTAIGTFAASVPEVRRIVLWGLCDAASAACFYAPGDARVVGLALLNPWVHTEAGESKAYLRHYYWRRVLSSAFWKKAIAGKLNLGGSIRDFGSKVARASRGEGSVAPAGAEDRSHRADGGGPLPERMLGSLRKFPGRLLLLISGHDIVAAEFADLTRASPEWQAVLSATRSKSHHVPDANHTFSAAKWRDDVARQTLAWVLEDPSRQPG